MKIAVIGTAGKWSSEQLADELHKITGFRMLFGMNELVVSGPQRRVTARGMDLHELDALVVKKISEEYSHDLMDRLEILSSLKRSGLRIFSDPHAIGLAANRLSCTLRLMEASIPMPNTLITESLEDAALMIAKCRKVIAKPLFSTKARGMQIIENGPHVMDQLMEFASRNPILYLQEKVELRGRDYGLAFLGGKFIGAYARVGNPDSWNTTILSGGRYEPFDPPEEFIELATRAQAAIGLDFTGVDLAVTDQGPIVFEVSAFGGFSGLKHAKQLNAAELYARHVIARLEESHE